MTEVKESNVWLLSGQTRTLDLPGLTIELHPVVRLLAVPGLRWVGLLVAAMLDLGCDVHVRIWSTATPGFSYEQVMARSADVRLPAALGAKSG